MQTSSTARIETRLILSGLILLTMGIVLLLLQNQGVPPSVVEIRPTLTGQAERCLTCHNGIESPGPSHPAQTFGCVSCHGGQALAIDKIRAHTNMVRNPGALDVAAQYCGTCHPAQVATVPRTVMATYAGAITLVRRSFGLQTDGTAHFATADIGELKTFTVTSTDPRPVQRFAVNCLNCHLRTESIKEPYFYRSTGCSSCHVLYGNDGLYTGSDPTTPKDQPGQPISHTITKAIPYSQCNHCHNRGNYDLRTMNFLKRPDMPPPAGLTGDALRLHDYYQPIGLYTRCEWKLDCIDCHTANEIMGDGEIHNNRRESQYIQCSTCHGTPTSRPLQETYTPLPSTTNSAPTPTPGPAPAEVTVIITQRGELLKQTRLINGQWYLISKVTGETLKIPLVTGTKCQQKPDQQASQYCHECHSYTYGQKPFQ